MLSKSDLLIKSLPTRSETPYEKTKRITRAVNELDVMNLVRWIKYQYRGGVEVPERITEKLLKHPNAKVQLEIICKKQVSDDRRLKFFKEEKIKNDVLYSVLQDERLTREELLVLLRRYNKKILPHVVNRRELSTLLTPEENDEIFNSILTESYKQEGMAKLKLSKNKFEELYSDELNHHALFSNPELCAEKQIELFDKSVKKCSDETDEDPSENDLAQVELENEPTRLINFLTFTIEKKEVFEYVLFQLNDLNQEQLLTYVFSNEDLPTSTAIDFLEKTKHSNYKSEYIKTLLYKMELGIIGEENFTSEAVKWFETNYPDFKSKLNDGKARIIPIDGKILKEHLKNGKLPLVRNALRFTKPGTVDIETARELSFKNEHDILYLLRASDCCFDENFSVKFFTTLPELTLRRILQENEVDFELFEGMKDCWEGSLKELKKVGEKL